VAILRRWEVECSSFLVDVVVAILVMAKVLLNSSQWVGRVYYQWRRAHRAVTIYVRRSSL
jgi:hypothetical protein